jgi:hypothetical protein
MKNTSQLALFICIMVIILLYGCTSAPILPTNTPEPTATPFVMPSGDFQMSWDIYDNEYNSMGGTLTIRRHGTEFTETLEFSNGSTGTFDLTPTYGSGNIYLTGHLGITNSLYGDYMVITSDGWLGFYDSQGYIYSVPPLN